jgi:hypothetical protein
VQEHYTADPAEERIATWLQANAKALYRYPGCGVEPTAGNLSSGEEWSYWGTIVTSSRVMTLALLVPADRQSRDVSLRVTRAMKKLGWQSKSIRAKHGEFVWGWVVMQGRADEERGIHQKSLPRNDL